MIYAAIVAENILSISLLLDEIISAGSSVLECAWILSYTVRTFGKWGEMATMTRALKSQRINFRISEDQETLLRKGAEHKRQSITDFIVDSACIAAESELALQSEFKLPRPQWNAFLAALDKPATVNPALRRLLTEPSVIELANRK